MSVTKLSKTRWRAQIHVKGHGNRDVSKVAPDLFPTSIFATQKQAKDACHEARKRLPNLAENKGPTVSEFREKWLTDPLFARPKESTMIHNRERTKSFAARYGDLPIRDVDDSIAYEWINIGRNIGTVPTLRAMFNDAASLKAGRLVQVNPFAGLGIKRSKGNRYTTPPEESVAWDLIRAARRTSGPEFAAWLQVACFTGMRPGEVDALRWDAIDFEHGWIHVREQFNAKTRTFTSPKNGQKRRVPMTPAAREALLSQPNQREFCFVTYRDTHWTPAARAYHWKAVASAVGFEDSLYVASRHFFGSYAVNVLGLDSEDVAIAMGHTDGGELVRTLYGHRDHNLALERVRNAFDSRANVRPLRAVKEDTA